METSNKYNKNLSLEEIDEILKSLGNNIKGRPERILTYVTTKEGVIMQFEHFMKALKCKNDFISNHLSQARKYFIPGYYKFNTAKGITDPFGRIFKNEFKMLDFRMEEYEKTP